MVTKATSIGESYSDDQWQPRSEDFLIEGDLAERVLARLGLTEGRVVIHESVYREGYSSWTNWDEYEFTILVDDEEVWESGGHTDQAGGFGSSWGDSDAERLGWSNFARLNAWLEESGE